MSSNALAAMAFAAVIGSSLGFCRPLFRFSPSVDAGTMEATVNNSFLVSSARNIGQATRDAEPPFACTQELGSSCPHSTDYVYAVNSLMLEPGLVLPVGRTYWQCNVSGTEYSTIIQVEDDEPPVVSCPNDFTEIELDGENTTNIFNASTTLSLAFEATDNAGGNLTIICFALAVDLRSGEPTVAAGVARSDSGDGIDELVVGELFLNAGEYVLACMALDDNENMGMCVTSNFTLVDTTNPLITCPTVITDSGLANSASVAYAEVQASDETGIYNITCSHQSGSLFAIGTTQVECVAEDMSGNVNSCAFAITVIGTNTQYTRITTAMSLSDFELNATTFNATTDLNELVEGLVAALQAFFEAEVNASGSDFDLVVTLTLTLTSQLNPNLDSITMQYTIDVSTQGTEVILASIQELRSMGSAKEDLLAAIGDQAITGFRVSSDTVVGHAEASTGSNNSNGEDLRTPPSAMISWTTGGGLSSQLALAWSGLALLWLTSARLGKSSQACQLLTPSKRAQLTLLVMRWLRRAHQQLLPSASAPRHLVKWISVCLLPLLLKLRLTVSCWRQAEWNRYWGP